MWIFTQHGFYNVVCARDLADSRSRIAPDNLMVRVRIRWHLESLQKRFPQLACFEILDSANTDYRFRLVMPKPAWAYVTQEPTA